MKIHRFILPLMGMLASSFFSLHSLQFGFRDSEYSFQSLRAIAGTAIGTADVAECLTTISKIEEGNDESWYKQWNQTAQTVEKEAWQSKNSGHLLSAAAEFSRASNYYRTAEFFLHTNPKDPRIIKTWSKSRDCWRHSIANLDHPVKEVRIPFEKTTLPGYLCLVDNSGLARPLLIAQTGLDGTAEEVYYLIAQAAIARGYNCLVFEGPGQGEVIRVQGIPFRYNWETVVTPVVNYAIQLKEVNKDRMALMGISMGGYLVPRALAFEHRIKLGIANGGIYDFHEICMEGAPPGTDVKLDSPKTSAEIDAFIMNAAKTNPKLRWVVHHSMYTFQAKTPSEWLKMTRPYTMKGLAQNIKSKMLIIHSENDTIMKGQAKQLYDALKSPKDFMIFTAEEGAGEHCQVGAYSLSNEQIFSWLDNNL